MIKNKSLTILNRSSYIFWVLTIQTEKNTTIEKTNVFHGGKNVIRTVLTFFSTAQSRIDTCMDYTKHVW